MDFTATDAFVGAMGEIIEKLDTLKELALNHMGLGPDDIDWSHVKKADYIVEALEELVSLAGIE